MCEVKIILLLCEIHHCRDRHTSFIPSLVHLMEIHFHLLSSNSIIRGYLLDSLDSHYACSVAFTILIEMR